MIYITAAFLLFFGHYNYHTLFMRNIIAIGRIIIFKIDSQCIFATISAKNWFVDLRNGIYRYYLPV